jgi:DNA-binding transcriptional MocR family regulator
MTIAPPPDSPPLYIRIAENVAQQVSAGALRAGDRVPSLRQLGRQMKVSMTTAVQAYLWLENRGYLEARPRSGYYVRTASAKAIEEPKFRAQNVRPTAIDTDAVLSDIIEHANDPANVPFGVACASPDLFPTRKLNQIVRRVVREQPEHSARYEFGSEALRRQIARRSLATGATCAPRDVVITSGGLEGINLSLRALTKPGDVIAVESPTYFGILGTAASLNLRVIEIPTHPQDGMDLAALEDALTSHHVKACIAMPNCHNPLGYVLDDRAKKALVDLCATHNVPILEDDVYAELAFSGSRPRTLKSFDRTDLVLLCSSFSKTLAPGYRVGWVVTERFREKIQRLKLLTTVATPSLSQAVVAEFLESGAYDRFLKRLQPVFARQVDLVRTAVANSFPDGTRVTRPAGGHMLWVELPPQVNGIRLYRDALEKRISILPGTIFSARSQLDHHIRINCGGRWSPVHERALATLGSLCERQL